MRGGRWGEVVLPSEARLMGTFPTFPFPRTWIWPALPQILEGPKQAMQESQLSLRHLNSISPPPLISQACLYFSSGTAFDFLKASDTMGQSLLKTYPPLGFCDAILSSVPDLSIAS